MSEGSSGEPDLRAGLARDTYCLKLRKHLRDGRENRPHHPQARWAISGSSIASGTKRRREISPVALQHLARSRLRSPVLRAQNLKKKKKGERATAPGAAAVVAAGARASAIGVRRGRARAPLLQAARAGRRPQLVRRGLGAGPLTRGPRGGEKGRRPGASSSPPQSGAGEGGGGVGGGRRKRR